MQPGGSYTLRLVIICSLESVVTEGPIINAASRHALALEMMCPPVPMEEPHVPEETRTGQYPVFAIENGAHMLCLLLQNKPVTDVHKMPFW